MADSDKDNAEWQHDISVALDKIGYVKFQTDDKDGALKAYEESLDITRRLAASDPGNAIWRRDMAVGLNKVGDVKVLHGPGSRGRAQGLRGEPRYHAPPGRRQ